ncbi:MAG: ABC transporter permease [Acidobacteriota bacterium]
MHELRQTLRSLRRTPSFAFISTATLGLAIGAIACIFSVVDTVLLDPLPFPESDRLVHIRATAPGSEWEGEFGYSAEFWVQFQEESDLLESLGTSNRFTSTLRTADRTERIWMSAPTPSTFAALGVSPAIGRLPTVEDGEEVAVLSHALWSTWFGADPDVVGKTYSISGSERTVLGVMPEGFFFPNDQIQLWFPNLIETADIQPGRFGLDLVGRMAPGATHDALRTELELLGERVPGRFGGSPNYERFVRQIRPAVGSLESSLLGDISRPLFILLAAMGIVLLIACANVANLFMVRAERRQGDQAVRSALGAGRRRLVVFQLTEAGLIAGASGMLAVALAGIGVPLLIRSAPQDVPRLGDVTLTPTTLLVTFGVSALAAVLCGLAPALRFASPNLAKLREGTRGSTRRRQWGRQVLVAGQTALAIVLLVGAALLLRSFDALRNVDPGYDTDDLFTFQIAPEDEGLEGAEAFARFHLGFMDRLRALPGVESVGLVNNVPLNEGLADSPYLAEDGADENGTSLSYTWAAGDYFRTMGIEVVRGRTFRDDDHFSGAGPAILSRSAADLLWPGADPIGKRFRRPTEDPDEEPLWQTVIGVVDDVLQYGFRQEADPMIYFPLVGQDPENSAAIGSPAYVLKTARAETIAPEIRALVRQAAPSAPMYRTYTLDELARSSMNQLTFTLLTLGLAAGLALLLGVVGLYGVLSFTVAERTKEIGVRLALGADASRVRWMVVRQGARVLAAGVGAGLAVAAVSARSLGDLLFRVEAVDAATYGAIAALMTAVGLAACYIPAWRASRIHPVESLRSDG